MSQHEDMASRRTLAGGVEDISTVCMQREMGKGGKREGDKELKLRRSWGHQSSRYKYISTRAIQPNTQLSVPVLVSFVYAAVHRLKFIIIYSTFLNACSLPTYPAVKAVNIAQCSARFCYAPTDSSTGYSSEPTRT